MKRAALILFHVGAVLSLLFCLAAVGLWRWGRSAELVIFRVTPLSMHVLHLSRGELRVVVSHKFNPLDPYPASMLGWTSRTYPDSDLLADAPGIFPVPAHRWLASSWAT
jgi:hypothetical protein